MVCSDLLRAKSIQCEVAYQRDLKSVADAKAIESQYQLAAREKEIRFWREALSARMCAKTRSSQGFLNRENQLSNLEAVAQVERMRIAHLKFREAKDCHTQANKELKTGLESLAQSKKKIDLIQGLMDRAVRIRANQIEARLADEVADLVNGSRSAIANKGQTFGNSDKSVDVSSGQFTSAAINISRDTSNHSAHKGCESSSIKSAALLAIPATDNSLSVGRGGIHPTSLSLSDITCRSSGSEASLSLKCSFHSGASIGLSLTRSENGGIKVLVDPADSHLISNLGGENASLIARLKSLGIKVDVIEIGALIRQVPIASYKGRKRGGFEDNDYEDVIS